MWFLLLLQIFSSMKPDNDPSFLYGNWMSCLEADTNLYAERVFEPKGEKWELHLGPKDEFGLFLVPGPDGDHSHSGSDNLLNSYVVGAEKKIWEIKSLNLKVIISQAGEPPNENCESYFVEVRKLKSGGSK